MRLRFGKGFTRLRVGNSGTSNMGDGPRYIVYGYACLCLCLSLSVLVFEQLKNFCERGGD